MVGRVTTLTILHSRRRPGSGLPRRQPAGAAGRGGQRRQLRLPGPARRHQCAQFRRPEFRRSRHRHRHPLRARARLQGVHGAQHLSAGRQSRALAQRDRQGGGPGRRRRDPGRPRPACNTPPRTHPQLRLHLSVQGSATNYDAINFYREQFGIVRAVLPRVLSLAQVEQVIDKTPVEIEVFGFGSLCVMVEGRCALSSYVTGESPNTHGVCSPAKAVRWQETPARPGVAPERRADRPLRPRRERRLSDAVQGPLRRGRRNTAITRSRSPPA